MLVTSGSELGGHDFGHEFVSESVSEADLDTRFFGTSDTDSGKVMTSDTDMGQLSDTRVRPTLKWMLMSLCWCKFLGIFVFETEFRYW